MYFLLLKNYYLDSSYSLCVSVHVSSCFQINEAGKIKNQDIAKELCLPPVKLHCSSKYFFVINKYSDID